MTEISTHEAYGVLTEPDTLTIQRLLPGPIERVWAYLTEGELRRQWLAAGQMEMKVGAPFELVWRNDELRTRRASGRPGSPRSSGCRAGSPSSIRPAGSPSPGKAAATCPSSWSRRASEVLLTVIHRRLRDRTTLLGVSAGWHMHLDILVARSTGQEPAPFWDGWSRLRAEYDRRLPA